jgi:hypothetical protein
MRHQLTGLYLGLVLSLASGDMLAQKPTLAPEASMPASSTITFNGQVVYQDLEGGFWGLIDDAGRRYMPEQLAPAFQRDGLRVQVRATLAQEVYGVQMWGRRIHLLTIEKLDGGQP